MKKLLVLILLIPFGLIAQENGNTNVSGRVVGEANEGLPSATIAVKGKGNGTTSDSTGRFSLSLNHPYPFTLVISFAGYKSQQLVVKSNEVNDVLVQLQPLYQKDTIVVTSRRRREVLQDVPIAVSVINGSQVADAGAFNVNRVKEFVPSVQLYSSNPRNTGLSIRGLGATFGLTNDGVDPGVGFYVDGVYYARPAATTLDFVDIERVEVLRGPQGTLFGKNTTSGAFNITTKKASFTPGANFEVSYGNYGYVQAKASVTGPLSKKFAARLSFSGTQRDGVIYNIRTLKHINDINNLGFHGQLLYKPSDNTSVTLSLDDSRQRPDGYAQVIAGVAPTKRAAYRQFNAIIADLNYQLPSLNAFDRLVDHDTPWNSGNDLGVAVP
jgi:iron complex outermembrane receptor protein